MYTHSSQFFEIFNYKKSTIIINTYTLSIHIISILKPSIGINTYTFTLYTQNYELKCTVKYITTA